MEMRKRKHQDSPVFVPIDDDLRESLAEEASDTRLEYLYSLIDQLPDDEKKLIYLHLENLTNAQIAAILGSSESAVKQKVYRIRQKLIDQYQNSQYYE